MVQAQAPPANEIMAAMQAFLENKGKKEIAEINADCDREFKTGKTRMVEEEKQHLVDKFEKDLNTAEINAKIERSAQLNQVRIQKMKKLNEMVTGLQLEASKKLAKDMEANPQAYKDLIKDLLIQGFIKLIEPTIILRVRKSDLDLVKGQIEPAVKQYKQMMLAKVKAFEGKKDIPCRVSVDEANFLPEWNPEEPQRSCLGGFVMYAKKNRIVCSQTLDDRMGLVHAQAIPAIRSSLFPSLVKKHAPAANE